MNPPPPEPDPASGFIPPDIETLQELLPNFEVLELIGRGGMGAVYKARQLKLDRLVAIKILPAELTGDPEFAERFLVEARAMAKMKHSRIVTVHDFGETECGLLYIVMEYVDGTDLARLISDGSLSAGHIIPVLTQVCDALNYAHRRHVAHRDIKPGNIMLDIEGQVKVADFGLARIMAPGEQGSSGSEEETTMGSPDYVAPEQLEIGTQGDHRADIYALGVMAYEMLTGKIPRGDFPQVSKAAPGLDPRLDAAIARALEPDREARYQDVSQFWQDLDRIQSTPPPGKAGDQAPSPRKPVQLQIPRRSGTSSRRVVSIQSASRRKRLAPQLVLGTLTFCLLVYIVFYIDSEGGDEASVEATELSLREATVDETPRSSEPRVQLPAKKEPALEVENAASAPQRITRPAPAVNPPPAPDPIPDRPPATKKDLPKPKSEAELRIAELFAPYEESYFKNLGIEKMNGFYRKALTDESRKTSTSPGGKDPALKPALELENLLLDGVGNRPLVAPLPPDSPDRLVELRQKYAQAVFERQNSLAERASAVLPSIDKDLERLEQSFRDDGKEAKALEVAHARNDLLRQGLPFIATTQAANLGVLPNAASPSDPPRKRVEGSLRGSGLNRKGLPIDLSRAALFDDFIDVEYHGDHWAAIRSNGDVVSNDDRFQGLENVSQVVKTGPRNLVLYQDGSVACFPEDRYQPDGLPSIRFLSVGVQDVVAVTKDNRVVSWGKTLGTDGTPPPPGLDDVITVATTWGGEGNSTQAFALRKNGEIATWGGNQSDPILLPDDLPPIQDIEAGWLHLACLTRDGEVICLRRGPRGRLPIPEHVTTADRIRMRGPICSARLLDGQWHAWRPATPKKSSGPVAEEINQIRNAQRIVYKSSNPWRGVFWIEPREPVALSPEPQPIPEKGPAPASPLSKADFEIEQNTRDRPFTNSLGMTFVPVPISERPSDDGPLLFCQFETRIKDYRAFAKENPKLKAPEMRPGTSDEHPVYKVTWEQATAFCEWLTERESSADELLDGFRYRLPTDHEWSCAVGLGDRERASNSPNEKDLKIQGMYPWGKQWPPPNDAGNFAGEELSRKAAGLHINGFEDDFPFTAPVKSFKPNALGIYDLGGNLWEWCEDRSQGGRERVLRGGCWVMGDPRKLESSARKFELPDNGNERFGFRIVLEQPRP